MPAFYLGRNPVTNEEYNAHVERYLSEPFVLLITDPKTYKTSILCRLKSPEEAIGKHFADSSSRHWREPCEGSPFMFGVLTLIELRKDLSPEGFNHPKQPVSNVSWFHAFEYCVSNGFFLPSDDQWSYAAGGPKGRRYATSTGKLYAEDGKTKLAHFEEETTVDVDDPRYPDGPRGLRHMTGNVSEWVDDYSYEGIRAVCRGGGFGEEDEEKVWDPEDEELPALDVNTRIIYSHAESPSLSQGFRVAAGPIRSSSPA